MAQLVKYVRLAAQDVSVLILALAVKMVITYIHWQVVLQVDAKNVLLIA